MLTDCPALGKVSRSYIMAKHALNLETDGSTIVTVLIQVPGPEAAQRTSSCPYRTGATGFWMEGRSSYRAQVAALHHPKSGLLNSSAPQAYQNAV